jgi:hypothetical protein
MQQRPNTELRGPSRRLIATVIALILVAGAATAVAATQTHDQVRSGQAVTGVTVRTYDGKLSRSAGSWVTFGELDVDIPQGARAFLLVRASGASYCTQAFPLALSDCQVRVRVGSAADLTTSTILPPGPLPFDGFYEAASSALSGGKYRVRAQWYAKDANLQFSNGYTLVVERVEMR